jgi:WD40 repeat protein
VMTFKGHGGTTRHWISRVCSRIALAFLGCWLLMAGVPIALAGPTFPFTQVAVTQVAGSPFTFRAVVLNGTETFAPFQVVFSPNGANLLSTTPVGVYRQTVSKSGVVSDPVSYLHSSFCKYPKGFALGALGSGNIDSVAYSRDGALLAEVEEPVVRPIKGEPTGGVLHIYRISGSKLLKGSCRTLPGYGYHIAFGPAGRLALTNAREKTLTIYSVSAAGKTHQISVFATGNHPDAVAFGPTLSSGQALAVANGGDNTISTFTVSSGLVAPAAGSPFTTVAGPSSLAFSPTGLLAVAGSVANLIDVYSVSFVGALNGAGAAHSAMPQMVAFSTTGKLLGSADYSDASLFAVSTGGLLAPVSGSPFSPEGAPNSIAFDHHHFLLAVGTSRGTAVYAYAPSTTTTPTTATTVTVTMNEPQTFAFTLSTPTQTAVSFEGPKLTIPAGEVTFNVSNPESSIVSHTFKLCNLGTTGPTCPGTSTPVLAYGTNATFTVELTPGTYRYVSSVPGDFASGMHGELIVT